MLSPATSRALDYACPINLNVPLAVSLTYIKKPPNSKNSVPGQKSSSDPACHGVIGPNFEPPKERSLI